MIKKILQGLLGIIVVLFVGLSVAYVATSPQQPEADSSSAKWLVPGAFSVAQQDFVFVDTQRATNANKDYAGTSSRTLKTTIWYPEEDSGPHPLVVYSHGFLSSRTDGTYLAENLATHGYVVAAANFPLTYTFAPGGPKLADVVNQPEDVSFIIDSVLGLEVRPFSGEIDVNKIGVMGLSLGGLTTELVTFHPKLRDDRIRASVSIAGPAAMFSKRFFDTTDIPFLMIAGTVDALVNYEANALIIPERASSGSLLTIAGGSHTAFASVAEPMMRGMNNPDSIGCYAVLQNIDRDSDENPFAALGGENEGIVVPEISGLCDTMPLPESLHPGRQHMITQIGVLSFFESVFASTADDRQAAGNQLVMYIEQDFAEASYTD